MIAEQAREQLVQTLMAEIEQTDRMVELLRQSHAIFSGRDAALIERTAAIIYTEVEKLQALERRREALVTGCGFSADKQGIEACLSACLPDERPRELWHRLLGLATQARSLNQINAGIVETSRRHAQKALNLIRGQVPGGELYSRGGLTRGYAGSRSLAKA